MKLAQKLKKKRLYKHLEQSLVAKSVVSDIKSNDETSQVSQKRTVAKVPMARYRRTKKYFEKRGLKTARKHNPGGFDQDISGPDSSKCDNSLNSSPTRARGMKSYLAHCSSAKQLA